MSNKKKAFAEEYRKKLNHDLRSCLGAIRGFQEILLEDGDLDDMQKNYITRIGARCDEAYVILDELHEKIQKIFF